MPEIREETDEQPPSDPPRAGAAGSSDTTTGGGFPRMIEHLKSRKVDSVLWALRAMTIFFGILYVFPISVNQFSCYQKALMAGAATNALRLHQRLGGSFQLNMAFFQQLFVEDACHYLFYCIIFMGVYPVTMALMPVFFFALLHWTSFTIQLLNVGGYSNGFVWRMLTKFVDQYSQTLLQVIACCEIFLMPMIIFMIFSGRSNLLIPFVYYRFLTLRYLSRRNPSTRMAFQHMRYALEQSVNRPNCPAVLRNIAYKLIAIVCRFGPQQQAPPTAAQ